MGELLQNAAAVLLLACVAARPFLGEVPFRTSSLHSVLGPQVQSSNEEDGGGASEPPTVSDRAELARVTFAIVLLTAAVLWAAGGAIGARLSIRRGWLLAPILAFAALSALSAWNASDKRAATDDWVEQLSLLAACFLAAQLFADNRRWGLLLVVLAALAGAMAAKGLWQVFVEAPDRVADFEAYRNQRLAQFGWAPGTPQAVLVEARLRDTSPFGYFGLANIFASLLVLLFLAGAGLAADKIAFAMRVRKEGPWPRSGKDIDLSVLAAAISAAVAALCGAVLVLTRSKGGVIAAAIAVTGAMVVCCFRERLSRHWRKVVVAVAIVFVLGLGVTLAYGLKYDRLPTKTMTFRWYYWTGGAGIVRDHPLLGVGGGNFPAAYLAHRRAAAEEAVKAPHNVIVQALAEYGIPGGLAYLAIIAAVLVAICRPRREEQPQPPPLISRKFIVITLLAVVAAMLAARCLFTASATNVFLLLFDAVFPAVVLAAAFFAASWAGRRLGRLPEVVGPFCRIALAAAAAGFVLHNMVEFSLQTPGAALVFWTVAGACLARAGGEGTRGLRLARWPAVLAMAVLAVWACLACWKPVYDKTMLTDAMLASFKTDRAAAARLAVQAARADRGDPLAAADAAKMVLSSCSRQQGLQQEHCIDRALDLAMTAVARDRSNPAWRQLAGTIAWYRAAPDAYTYLWTPGGGGKTMAQRIRSALSSPPADPIHLCDLAGAAYARGQYADAARLCELAIERDANSQTLFMHLAGAAWRAGDRDKARQAWKRAAELAPPQAIAQAALDQLAAAVKLNPQDLRLRIQYAQMLADAARPNECLQQLQAALEIDGQLMPESVERLNPDERKDLDMLSARVQVLRPSALSAVN